MSELTELGFPVPVLGFAAASGAGKTTLLTRVLPELVGAGLHVAVIKHSHHDFQIDYPGKDSHAARLAGAEQVLIASPYRLALIAEGLRQGISTENILKRARSSSQRAIQIIKARTSS